MGVSCCSPHPAPVGGPGGDEAHVRRALWIALAVNAGMFLVEIVAGVAAGSAALTADALDFLSDSATYAISLLVIGLAPRWRARAALAKGMSLGVIGLWVAGTTIHHATVGTVPEAQVMGAIGVLALLANTGVAVMLFAFRRGDANLRSVWLCSRNDAIGNVAVLLAAAGVFGTGTGWPDVIVGGVMATLALSGAWQIVRHARRELRDGREIAFQA